MTAPIEYEVDGITFTGMLAVPAGAASVPGILVAHEAPGVTEHVQERARRLADAGYLAFALDLYGERGLPLEQARAHAQRLMADAALMRRRARAALEVLAAHPRCDRERLGAIGFCLGGIVALELARDSAPIRCAVGFHPGLKRPAGSATGAVTARVLMVVGDADPVVPPEDRRSFREEMNAAGADWQLLTLGGVGHSFTNPAVDALGFPGFAYDERADRRGWRAMLALFEEVF